MTNKLLADIPIGPGNGGFKGFGPLGNPTGTGITNFSNFISTVIGVMTIVAIIWFIFIFMIGAIGIMSSGGDKNALETNKKKITTGVVGLVIVLTAVFAISLVGYIFGIDFLNIFALFYTLVPGSSGVNGGFP